jgi:hypothetical protein
MIKILSAQFISGATAAALVASLAAFFTPVASQASAETQRGAAALQRSLKGDRLPLLVTGRTCSFTSWPNYDRGCQFDLRRSADDIRTVRIVNMEKTVSPVVVANKY